MAEKFLLYIDILGFSDLVAKGNQEVDRLYSIIDNLNVHSHQAFRTIVFSDTILVYNQDDPLDDHDREVIVGYSCEFAQNLFFSSIGTGIYFRAILRLGDFEHKTLKNLQSFYGQALISSYSEEKSLPCTGLFIHSSCRPYNKYIPTKPFTDDLDFVYLTRSLEWMIERFIDEFPVVGEIVELIFEDSYFIVRDVAILREINTLMRNHPLPAVRAKYLATWDMYLERYRNCLEHLVKNDFHLSAISPSLQWEESIKSLAEEVRGRA